MSEIRKRSSILIHFIDLDNGKAECRISRVKISWLAGSTNNLQKHMKVVHPPTLLEKVRKVCYPSQQGDPSSASTSTTSGTRSDPDPYLDASEPDDPTSTQPVNQTSSRYRQSKPTLCMLTVCSFPLYYFSSIVSCCVDRIAWNLLDLHQILIMHNL